MRMEHELSTDIFSQPGISVLFINHINDSAAGTPPEAEHWYKDTLPLIAGGSSMNNTSDCSVQTNGQENLYWQQHKHTHYCEPLDKKVW